MKLQIRTNNGNKGNKDTEKNQNITEKASSAPSRDDIAWEMALERKEEKPKKGLISRISNVLSGSDSPQSKVNSIIVGNKFGDDSIPAEERAYALFIRDRENTLKEKGSGDEYRLFGYENEDQWEWYKNPFEIPATKQTYMEKIKRGDFSLKSPDIRRL